VLAPFKLRCCDMGSVNELKCYKVKREKSSNTNSALEFFKVNTSFLFNLVTFK
jgi:hypothetical protein